MITNSSSLYLRSAICVIFSTVITLCLSNAAAGELDEFEADATESKPDNSIPVNSRSHQNVYATEERPSSFGDVFVEFIFDLGGAILGAGGEASRERATSPSGHYLTARQTGEPLIPLLRLDTHWQNAYGDIEAIDTKIEVGQGPFAGSYRSTSFREKVPDDRLKVNQAYVLYRMSFGNQFGMNLGFGKMELEGKNRNSGFSVTAPIYYHWHRNLGVEFNYSRTKINNNVIVDKEVSILLSKQALSASFGYRDLGSPNRSIRGPFIGLSLRL